MFEDVRFRSVGARNVKTNPIAPARAGRDASASSTCTASGAAAPAPSGPGAPAGAAGGSKTFENARQCSAPARDCKTNPPPMLAPRQVSAARLLLAGRTCRAAARELGVEEHTIYRWRKLPAFRAELERQQRALLAIVASPPAPAPRRPVARP
jgi:hypothetical protein